MSYRFNLCESRRVLPHLLFSRWVALILERYLSWLLRKGEETRQALIKLQRYELF
jgi:hypothetical protein